MKYQDRFSGNKGEFADFIKKMIPDLFGNRLVVEGKQAVIPNDSNLDYKIKYDEDEFGGSVTLKVSWDTGEPEEDDEVNVETD